jgi:hypothetical protein
MERALQEIQQANLETAENKSTQKRGRKPKTSQKENVETSNESQQSSELDKRFDVPLVGTIVKDKNKAEQNEDAPIALRRSSRRAAKIQNYQEIQKDFDEPLRLNSNEDVTSKPVESAKESKKAQTQVSKSAKVAEEVEDLPILDNYDDVHKHPLVETTEPQLETTEATKNKKKNSKKASEASANTETASTKNLIRRPKPKTKAGLVAFALSQLSTLTDLMKDDSVPYSNEVTNQVKDVLHNLSSDNYKLAMFLENKRYKKSF